MVNVNVINSSSNELPQYETKGSAGLDVRANLPDVRDIQQVWVLRPGERRLVPTGLKVEIPEGYEIQVRPRSGLAFKNGVTVINSPGTIDSDYRGEIGIVLINHSDTNFEIKNGDRIGQLVLNKVEQLSWVAVKNLNETDRGEGGYGSTGTNIKSPTAQNI